MGKTGKIAVALCLKRHRLAAAFEANLDPKTPGRPNTEMGRAPVCKELSPDGHLARGKYGHSLWISEAENLFLSKLLQQLPALAASPADLGPLVSVG